MLIEQKFYFVLFRTLVIIIAIIAHRNIIQLDIEVLIRIKPQEVIVVSHL